MLRRAGFASDEAWKILGRETAAVGLWLDGKPKHEWPPYLRYCRFRFVYNHATDCIGIFPVNPMEITVKGPLIGVVAKARFQLDAEQIEALIAKLTAPASPRPPKRKRGKSKPKPGTRKAWALDRLREKATTTKILRAYQKKFGEISDPQKVDNLRRNIDRWREKVEAEKNSDN
jgi:hypothetical protein